MVVVNLWFVMCAGVVCVGGCARLTVATPLAFIAGIFID